MCRCLECRSAAGKRKRAVSPETEPEETEQADGGQTRACVGNDLRHGKPLPLGTHSLQYMNSTSGFPASARLAECIYFRRLLSTRFALLCFFRSFCLLVCFCARILPAYVYPSSVFLPPLSLPLRVRYRGCARLCRPTGSACVSFTCVPCVPSFPSFCS